MRYKFEIKVDIPEGVSCTFEDRVFECKKGDVALKKTINIPRTEIIISDKEVSFSCPKANKKDIAMIKSNASHVTNMFKGIEERYTYQLEICHVHFPMTVKVEGNKVVVSNFLGEKVDRIAKIVEGVEVSVKGNKIEVAGNDIEKAGQTAANIEKSAVVPRKDRRVFQDGIFITHKPRGAI